MSPIVSNLFIFLLATFVGLEVIRRVSPLLHTPLMSLTNAISAISLVGSLTLLGRGEDTTSMVLGGIAVVASMTNVVSGFLITERMLRMFKSDKPKAIAQANAFTLPIFMLAAVETGAVDLGSHWVTDATYLVGSALFVMSLKWMNHPTTARRSVAAGALGMGLAVAGTLFALTSDPVLDGRSPAWAWIAGTLVLGTIIGYPISLVPMTAVPQRTAFSHAFGGLAAGMVGTAEYFLGAKAVGNPALPQTLDTFTLGAIGLEVLLGFITFTGSLIAFGKLAEKLPGAPITYKGQNLLNFTLLGIAIVCAVMVVINPAMTALYLVFCALALIFGVLLVIPIGGADMPTVISILNSYAGLSACAMGFVLKNPLLIIAGALDGSSGLILSIIMCKAMNRSFANVLFGAFGQPQEAKAIGEQRPIRSASPEEAASILGAAQNVVIVPGYGMAVAQAQHKVRELYDALTKKGVNVRFAIHPVAGRMPGHMNVLLAEADIPYEKLVEMDDINSDMPQTDVALIIGANDVTNPDARNEPTSPIYGMPIINVDYAHTVMVIKRSMRSGFAGIENPLYYMDRTLMLFGDAKQFVGEIVKELGSSH
jgi:NAD(P) transhydrogenase subunit beta